MKPMKPMKPIREGEEQRDRSGTGIGEEDHRERITGSGSQGAEQNIRPRGAEVSMVIIVVSGPKGAGASASPHATPGLGAGASASPQHGTTEEQELVPRHRGKEAAQAWHI